MRTGKLSTKKKPTRNGGAFYCRCKLEPLLALRAGEATMRGRDGQRVPKRAEAFWEEGGATEKRSFSVKKSEAE